MGKGAGSKPRFVGVGVGVDVRMAAGCSRRRAICQQTSICMT